jgi:hypothetical protein
MQTQRHETSAVGIGRMRQRRHAFCKGIALGIAFCLIGLAATSPAMAQRRGGHGGPGDGKDRSAMEYFHGNPMPTQATLTLHGGQYMRSETRQFEYIIMPRQIRIYVYDKELHPLAANGVQVYLTYQLPSETRTRKAAFEHSHATGVDPQDYLVAMFDSSTLPEKNMAVTFVFSGVPLPEKPITFSSLLTIAKKRPETVSFTPLISRADVRPYVARVQYTEADAARVAQQRICPVSGKTLDPRGQVVKVLVGETPLYLGNDDDVAEVRATPEKYLARQQTPTSVMR